MDVERRRRPWVLIGLLALGLVGSAAALLVIPLGPRLIEITDPAPGHTRSNEAFEVFVRFPAADRVRPDTLGVWLNGAEVTGSFSVAENGAIGEVVLLVDGENSLEAAVFGAPWWAPERLVEHRVQLSFRVVRALDLDQG